MRGTRSVRVAEQMRRELAELIRTQLKDPRVPGLISVTEVSVSPDLAHAKVYFTVLGDASCVQDALSALQRAAGFLRAELGRRMTVRTVPKLVFEFDESIARGMQLSQLIDKAAASSSGGSGGVDE